MSKSDGNRARFFPSIQVSDSPTSVIPVSEKCPSTLLAPSAITANGLPGGTLNCTTSRELGNDVIAQRTRMIETETLFKPRKDREGRLNLSGLLKGNKSRDNLGITQSATITEISEKSPEISQNHSTILASTDKPSALNVQTAAFIPPGLNVFKISELSVETPINQKSFHVNQLSREDHLVSDEVLMLSGNPQNSFQPSDVSATVRGVGTKNDLIGIMNKTTFGTKYDQYPSYEDPIRNSRFLAQPNNTNGDYVHNGKKRGSDRRENGVPGPVTVKKRKENDDAELDRNRDFNLMQPSSSPESYVSRPPDDPEPVSQVRLPSTNSFATALGRDIEHYIAAHLDDYERAKARWTNCSREEWEHGAEEIAERFTQLLDFVKAHMKRKVALYASLQTKLNDHQSVRNGITEMLKEAKDELVTKTGVLIEKSKSN